MDVNPDVLIFYACRYSTEMGAAAEAVLKGAPTRKQREHLYRLLKRDGGKHLSPTWRYSKRSGVGAGITNEPPLNLGEFRRYRREPKSKLGNADLAHPR